MNGFSNSVLGTNKTLIIFFFLSCLNGRGFYVLMGAAEEEAVGQEKDLINGKILRLFEESGQIFDCLADLSSTATDNNEDLRDRFELSE